VDLDHIIDDQGECKIPC